MDFSFLVDFTKTIVQISELIWGALTKVHHFSGLTVPVVNWTILKPFSFSLLGAITSPYIWGAIGVSILIGVFWPKS